MASIGIDLGTTYCCVGVVRKRGRVEIIANDKGNRITPSCVAFTDDERLIGEYASHYLVSDPENTVYDAKRLIGRAYDDDSLQKDITRWPFEVKNVEKRPVILVKDKKEVRQVWPEEVSGMVLSRMKSIAEVYLGQEVKNAVITVPAYFNAAQRKATSDAAKIAGINLLAMINEPTAAALAYGLEKGVRCKRNVLIFDLGGGTFDVTVLTIDVDGTYDVLATAGDTHLGGEDFNFRLLDHLVEEFTQKYKCNVRQDRIAMGRLRVECERVKISLSTSNRTRVEMQSLIDGVDFTTSVTRARFEDLNDELFESTLEIVEMALEKAGKMDKKAIDEVVLVGGSTRIPRIQGILEEFFGKKRIKRSINPDEAVAYGAAAHAAHLSGDQSENIKRLKLHDVTPLSFGIGIREGLMSIVIKGNTKLPVSERKQYDTAYQGQKTFRIAIFEGERAKWKDNTLLGYFDISDIPAGEAGKEKVVVFFDIDESGILKVSAEHSGSGRTKNVTFAPTSGRLTSKEIKQIMEEAEKYREEDRMWKERAIAIRNLVSLASKLRKALHENGEKKPGQLKHTETIYQWAKTNKGAPLEEIKRRISQLYNISQTAEQVLRSGTYF